MGKIGGIGGMLDQKSILSIGEVGNIAGEYGINHPAISTARPTERVRAASKGWVGLYLDYFKEEFRIPVSPFLVDVLKY